MKKEKKDLLIITEFYYPDIASTGKLLTQLAEDLVEKGISVDVLTGLPSEGHTSFEQNNGVNIFRVKSWKLDKKTKFGRLMRYFSFTFSILLKIFRLRNYKSVLIVSNPPLLPFVGYLSTRLFNNKFIYLIHDLYPDIAISLKVIHPDSLMAKAMNFINQKVFYFSRRIIVLGEDMKSYLISKKRVNESKITVIPNWADKNVIHKLSKSNHLSTKLGIDKKFLILYSGNIGLFQNLEMIIETAKLLKEDRDIHFLFVGEGGKKDKLIGLSKEYKLDNVSFLSYQSDEDYPYLLASADCHIVTLEEEAEGLGVPSKTYSYLASGRPVIAIMSDKTDVGNLIETNGVGFRINQNDILNLKNSILNLYRDKNLALQMGERARDVFEERYERKVCTSQYYEIIRQQID